MILGDITHAKDCHDSSLVNRIIEELESITCLKRLLKGNHDYLSDPEFPFFKFVSSLSDTKFIISPQEEEIAGTKILYLPHSRTPKSSWPSAASTQQPDLILFHQAISGATVSSGMQIDSSVDAEYILRYGNRHTIAIGGDIHVPQKISRCYYVGSPHPVAFGDIFKPRILVYDSGEIKSIDRITIRKVVLLIDNASEFIDADLKEGDHVRVSLRLDRKDFFTWNDQKQLISENAQERGLVLYGPDLIEKKSSEQIVADNQVELHSEDVDQTVSRYCQAKGVSESLKDAGIRIIRGVS